MFKVISAEIKKILSKPSIYVLAIILAFILVLGVFIYKPTSKENTSITLNGTTFTDKYENDFNNSYTGGYKKVVEDNINKTIESIGNYIEIVDGEKTNKNTYINSLFLEVDQNFKAYRNCANDSSEPARINTLRNNLVTSLKNLDSAIVSEVSKSATGSYALLTTDKSYKTYSETIKQTIAWAEINVEKSALAQHCKEFELNLKHRLQTCLNNFIYPVLSIEIINDFTTTEGNTKLSILYKRLYSINDQIEQKYAIAKAEGVEVNTAMASTMDDLANLYINTANTYLNLVKYQLLSNAFSFTSSSQELSLLHLSNYSEYNINSLKVKYDYLFENNKIEDDYSNPLVIGTTSNKEINAYDYAYFILRLFAFVIIAYSVMLACHSIAGEIKDGSMRYMAIRPVSRTELYFGKLISIILLTSILIIFSGIVSLIVGGFIYGFSTFNILTIFNGTNAIVVHPIIMILIFLANLILESIIYISIALLLSSLFKSDLLSITIMLLIYLINVLLPLFVQGANTWLAFYPFAHISIYPLFGSAIYASGNFFNLLLGAKVYSTTSVWLTITVISLISLIINFISVTIFNRKEL